MTRIKLTKGKYVIVDEHDFEWLNQWRWYYASSGYAMRKPWIKEGKGKSEIIVMHRLIMGAKKGQEVDHINRDRLDNRRSNLRIVTSQQQRFNMSRAKNNTSGHKGISWSKERNKWVAQIQINKKNIPLGRYENLKDALLAREEAERRYFII